MLLVLLLILLVLVLLAYYYNRIVVLENRVENALAQVEVQLKRRSDLIPNLVNTVKGYAAHEAAVFERVNQARERMMRAGGLDEKAQASAELAQALRSLFALAEAYPELKADENFQALQAQLEETENGLAYARQFFNDTVLEYNNAITTLPGLFLARLMGRRPRPFFRAEEGARQVPEVGF